MEQFFRQVLGLKDAQLIQTLASISRREVVKKGELLFRAGERHDCIYFLKSGIVCGMILSADGQLLTDCIAFLPGELIMPSDFLPQGGALHMDMSAYYSAEVIEDSALFRLPVAAAREVLANTPEAVQLQNRLLIYWTERHWQLKLAKQQMPALERYQWFLKQYPGLIDRIPNKYIASFLGMTPVTLSRLRRNLRGPEQTQRG